MTDRDSDAELRKAAEVKVATRPSEDTGAGWPEAAQHTLHELQVHQIELELQNEELRRIQAELEASRARYFNLYDLAPVAYCTVSEAGVILEGNLTAATLLGVARSKLVDERFTRFIHHVDQDQYYLHHKRLFETGQPQACELRLGGPDGTPRWARLEATVVPDASGAQVCWVVMSDISKRKQDEAAIAELNANLERRVAERTAALQETNNELAAFSYSVSHDLRAPLRAIDGFSHALFEELGPSLNERSQSDLTRIRLAAQHMGRLIDDILQLFRLSAGDLHVETVDLSGLACRVVEGLRQRHPERNATVEVEPGLRAEVDPLLFGLALENLLGNAWKFTSHVSEARIQLSRETLPDGERAFCVRDNGAGFDMAYSKRLFEPFQRLHGADEFEGTGIGLAIVLRVLRRHGGQIWAEGTVNQGAAFFFSLPNLHGRAPT